MVVVLVSGLEMEAEVVLVVCIDEDVVEVEDENDDVTLPDLVVDVVVTL